MAGWESMHPDYVNGDGYLVSHAAGINYRGLAGDFGAPFNYILPYESVPTWYQAGESAMEVYQETYRGYADLGAGYEFDVTIAPSAQSSVLYLQETAWAEIWANVLSYQYDDYSYLTSYQSTRTVYGVLPTETGASTTFAPIPEPATWALAVLGLGFLGIWNSRRKMCPGNPTDG
jgi:hypothetical protein